MEYVLALQTFLHPSITEGTCIVLIVFGFAAFVVLVSVIANALKSRSPGRLSDEDTRAIQQLYRGFEELDKRIEALETILLDRSGKG